jgi:hypothetical protein
VSYSFVVTAKDSTLTVGTPTGPVPDGTYQVNGHEDEDWRSITVTRADDKQTVAQATSNTRRTL